MANCVIFQDVLRVGWLDATHRAPDSISEGIPCSMYVLYSHNMQMLVILFYRKFLGKNNVCS